MGQAGAERRRAGSLLVITLWIVTILATLAIAIGRYLSTEARLIKYRLARERAMALARSGVYLAMERLQQDQGQEPYDWLGDEWARPAEDQDVWVVSLPGGGSEGQEQDGGRDARGRIEIRMTDEERKLNLNEVSAAVLTDLLMQARIPLDVVKLANTIVEYRDPKKPGEDWSEGQPPYFAKNQLFAAPEELYDLPEMTPQAYQVLASATTCYTASLAALNINTVTPEVLLAMGVSEDGRDKLVAYREQGHAFETETELINQLREKVFLRDEDINTLGAMHVTSQAFTVVSEGIVQAPAVRARVRAVVRRSTSSEKELDILAWREG